MGITFSELERLIRELLPEELKTKGDFYGWMETPPEGDYIKKIAVVVDTRKEPTDYDVLITHHKPYGKLNLPTFVVHTPLDRVEWGTAGSVARLLNLRDSKSLTEDGFGIVGTYAGGPLLETVKDLFGIYPVRYHFPKPPRRVAVFPGCGFLFEKVLNALREKGAEMLISGDLTYHTALKLRAEGIGYIDVGHYTSEKFGVRKLAEQLGKLVPDGVEVDFIDWGEI